MNSTDNEKKSFHSGASLLNVLKSMTAITLMGLLVLFSKSYFDDGKGRGPSSNLTPASAATPVAPPAPSVVGHVVADADLSVGREYIGRVEPIQTVLLKPQAAGQIEAVHFKEGSIVKAGDLLFTIDDAQYQATVSLRRADLSKAEANLSRAVKYNERLRAADARSVSASDLDMAASDVLQSRAAVEQAKAALKLAQIDLGYTKVTAPITGRIGRIEYTKGNYVSLSEDPLASIVQIDPIRVSYAMPDRDYMEQFGAFQSQGNAVYDTTITLPDGVRYEHKGERDFEDPAIDAMTGTITMHLRFDNSGGVLIPGSMVRVSTKPKKMRVSPVIPEEALLADSDGDFVYVIDENDAAQRRNVELGTEIGTTREVISGLVSGEKVILRGQQNVRPGMPVKPNYPSTDGAKTPAELARESGYDLPALSPGTGQDNSSEGTN
ncbi:MAG: efflux RND transporter periplasmic adaptor subunit [Synergistaceae bacterium]|jgi:RND family efflux transporter MFP subunit|nr:efflux RND transporter periplasmic adaptor subunit [Synergistaceae bacterium]